jgi:hypothetical protein
MWKAFLEDASEQPVANDSVNVRVRFKETLSKKEIVKEYNLHAGQFETEEAFKAFIEREKELLTNFDTTRERIINLIGKEIK